MRVTTIGRTPVVYGAVLVMDFTNCPAAQGRLLRLTFDVYETTGSSYNTTIMLCADKGGWYYNVFVANNQDHHPTNVYNASNDGGLGYQNIAMPVGFVDFNNDSHNLVILQHSYDYEGAYNYDIKVDVIDGESITPLDGTGTTFRLTDTNASLVTADPIGNGLLEVDFGGGEPAPACFWVDLVNLRQQCAQGPGPEPPVLDRTYGFRQSNSTMYGYQVASSSADEVHSIAFSNTIRYTAQWFHFAQYWDPVRVTLFGAALYRQPRNENLWQTTPEFVRNLGDIELALITPFPNWSHSSGDLGYMFEGAVALGEMDDGYVYYVRAAPVAYDESDNAAIYTSDDGILDTPVYVESVEATLPMEITVTPVPTGIDKTLYLTGARVVNVYNDDYSEFLGLAVLAGYRGQGTTYEQGGCMPFDITSSVTVGVFEIDASCS